MVDLIDAVNLIDVVELTDVVDLIDVVYLLHIYYTVLVSLLLSIRLPFSRLLGRKHQIYLSGIPVTAPSAPS